ncbi:MAG: hypothetical protein QOF63_2199 [Thermoanaerobaculia bacterium]|jgi:hypothetical protein|nr:hypothetical protein [Thermoanaerobaculia bacterium]
MRTLTVRFFAAEDGSPIDGSATLLAGRWRTAVGVKQKPLHGGPEVRFEVDDTTVVNEVLVSSVRRFSHHEPWPKSDVLEVRLEKSAELIVAVNHDDERSIMLHATAGQHLDDFVRTLGKEPHALRSGRSLDCTQLLPGPYVIEVFDRAKQSIAKLPVDLVAWRTTFVEVP